MNVLTISRKDYSYTMEKLESKPDEAKGTFLSPLSCIYLKYVFLQRLLSLARWWKW